MYPLAALKKNLTKKINNLSLARHSFFSEGGNQSNYKQHSMRSFTAQIIYRIECEGLPTDQYEEQWRLVYADDEEHGLVCAREAGKQEEATDHEADKQKAEMRLLKNGAQIFGKSFPELT